MCSFVKIQNTRVANATCYAASVAFNTFNLTSRSKKRDKKKAKTNIGGFKSWSEEQLQH